MKKFTLTPHQKKLMSLLRDAGFMGVRYWSRDDEEKPDRLQIYYMVSGDVFPEAMCYFIFDDIDVCSSPKLKIFFKSPGRGRDQYAKLRIKALKYFDSAIRTAKEFDEAFNQ